MSFVTIEMVRQQGVGNGVYLNRYVTDTQHSRHPIFIATFWFWIATDWLFFYVARSSRINLDMRVACTLKNSQLACSERNMR